MFKISKKYILKICTSQKLLSFGEVGRGTNTVIK